MDWTKVTYHDPDYRHTSDTMYVTNGYTVWKGRLLIAGCYRGDKWHLQRTTDKAILYSAKTAKECMENLEYAINLHDR